MLYEFDGRRPTIDPTAYVSETAIVIGDVAIGPGCYIGHGAVLRGDYGSIVIDAETAVEEGVIIHAPPQDTCAIGKRVTLGHGAIIHAKSIGDFAVIGMGTILSLWSEVGEGAIVGEGAVLPMRKSVEPDMVAMGNPAKALRPLAEKDRELWAWGKQLYVDLAEKYNRVGMIRIDETG